MKNIVLTGFMATGKSDIGRRLASALGYHLLDTDHMIESQTNKSIPQIFEDHGEAYFRQLEREVVGELANSEHLIIATGGGMIVDEKNYQGLHQLGPIICLEASPEVILERACRKQNRPLLEVTHPLEKIKELLAARQDAYARADLSIDTSQKTLDEVVETILDYVKTH